MVGVTVLNQLHSLVSNLWKEVRIFGDLEWPYTGIKVVF